ncbi:branched-chain amino acid transaminase [Rapidithrix thailandica]|uniref:Branched-chain-amino-acid aminotransferase n=1 Tax=Rapidithrix thailandica TaxID=413964 RepID=A0AAW9SEC3_9BACT
MLYPTKNTIVFHDGSFVKGEKLGVNPFSQTLHYGYGVFDALRAYDTALGPHIFKAREHYERFIQSAENLQLKVPYTTDELINITYQLLEKNSMTNAYIRPMLYLGTNMELVPAEKKHLLIAVWKWGKYMGKDLLDVKVSSVQKPKPKNFLVEAKICGQYLYSMVANNEARKEGYDAALMLDYEGYVAEGPGSNFFYENEGKLYTPPRGSILPGITRQTIINLAAELGVEVEERLFTPEELANVDAAFFTGTASQITGLKSIDGKPFKKKWEDTIGSALLIKYGHKVTQSEYDGYSII